MNQEVISNDAKVGTIGGTLLAIFEHITPSDMIKTIVMAVLGAVVSFTASLLCRFIWDQVKGKFKTQNKNENKCE